MLEKEWGFRAEYDLEKSKMCIHKIILLVKNKETCIFMDRNQTEWVLWGLGLGIQEKRKKKVREELAWTGDGNGLWSEVYYDLSSLHLGYSIKTLKGKKGCRQGGKR